MSRSGVKAVHRLRHFGANKKPGVFEIISFLIINNYFTVTDDADMWGWSVRPAHDAGRARAHGTRPEPRGPRDLSGRSFDTQGKIIIISTRSLYHRAIYIHRVTRKALQLAQGSP